MKRVYLDWNATAPLRPEARAAMAAAMDVVGNPSSVHAEGRAARGLVERARRQVAAGVGCRAEEVVFTSGATEAAALALAGRGLASGAVEHEAVAAWCDGALAVDRAGRVAVADPGRAAVQLANSETGIVQALPAGLALTDATQAIGKIAFSFDWSGAEMALVSAHKLGGPKGVGALILRAGPEGPRDLAPVIRGGGQESGRRSGTENIIGIAGFGAAVEASLEELGAGVMDRVAKLRDILEKAIAESAPETIFVGNGCARLPNTSCMITPGWAGETQVMVMDLAGYAISAGSACSSGKVRPSRVLEAMGYSAREAASAVRVSLGPTTTEDEVLGFAKAWAGENDRRRARAR